MITQADLDAADHYLNAQESSRPLRPSVSSLSGPPARESLDASQEHRAQEPASLAFIQGPNPSSPQPAGASPAVAFSPCQCETELLKMVEVQREVLRTLEEFLPHCAAASAKTRALMSELLAVSEAQSTFILRLKSHLAMRDLANIKL